jgi:hypothetical protein
MLFQNKLCFFVYLAKCNRGHAGTFKANAKTTDAAKKVKDA